MNIEKATAMALKDDWLERSCTSPFNVTAGDYPGGSVSTDQSLWGRYWYPWPHSYKPQISLTLTEVEHLRKLAKSDKKLRKTLQKFTPYIEVRVDFPG